MSDDLFASLRKNNRNTGSSSNPNYSFGGGDSPFSGRSTSNNKNSTQAFSPADAQKMSIPNPEGRPPAYEPPVVKDRGVVYEWEPPSTRESLKRMGMFMLEAFVAAGAKAVGDSIWYFIQSKRRFYTQDERDRRDWENRR